MHDQHEQTTDESLPGSEILLNSRERLTATCLGYLDNSSLRLHKSKGSTFSSQPIGLHSLTCLTTFIRTRFKGVSWCCFFIVLTFVIHRLITPTSVFPKNDLVHLISEVTSLKQHLSTIQLQSNALYKKQVKLDTENQITQKKILDLSTFYQQLLEESSRTEHDQLTSKLNLQELLRSFEQRINYIEDKLKSLVPLMNSRFEKLETSLYDKHYVQDSYSRDTMLLNLEDEYKRQLNDLQMSLQDLYKATYLDGTGKIDWVQISLGASIDENFTSVPRSTNFWNNLKWLLIFFFPRFYGKAQPRSHPAEVVIGGLKNIPLPYQPKYSITPGQCFAFNGHRGNITLRLPTLVNVTEVHLDHAPPQLLPSYGSAPLDFKVYIDDCLKDNCLRRLHFLHAPSRHVGTFTFAYPNHTSQSFPISASNSTLSNITHRIRFEFLTNIGETYTCIYRVRVHGLQVHSQEYLKQLKSSYKRKP